MTDLPFINFAFPASGAPTHRTMPDRLSDVVNVLDWGATSTTDNYDQINAAIQYCISRGGGTVFFPPGNYPIRRPLEIGSEQDVALQLVGCGQFASLLGASAGYSDPSGCNYRLSGGVGHTYDNLQSVEGLGGGVSVKMTRDAAVVRDVFLGAGSKGIGCNVVNSRGALVANCGGGLTPPPANDPNYVTGNIHGTVPGTICIALGSGTALGCRANGGWEVMYAMSGYGSALFASSTEVVGVGVRLGWGPDPVTGLPTEIPSYGATVQALETEKTWCSIDMYNCEGAYVAGNVLTAGDLGVCPPMAFSGAPTWSGGVVTVNTAADLNWTGKQTITLGTGNTSWQPHPSGFLEATRTGARQFQYSLAAQPAAWVVLSGEEGWTWPEWAHMRFRKVKNSLITATTCTRYSVTGFDMDAGGQAIHGGNNVMMGMTNDFGWIMPSDPKNLASWKFVNCGGNTSWNPQAPLPQSVAAPYGFMTFAKLPGQTGVLQPGPVEGQEYDIIDGSGTGTFDSAVTGGGSNKWRVRWNGSAWKRC